MFGLPVGGGGGIGILFSRDTGAVVMPGIDGADRTDASNKAIFLDYAFRNGESWYRFVNGTLGREADNGELYLITGFDKTNSWENAVIYNNSATTSCSLAFTTGGLGAEGRLWLSKTTSEGASLSHRYSADETLHNQSLFVRGFRISVRQGVRFRLGSKIKVVSTYKDSLGETLEKVPGGPPFAGASPSASRWFSGNTAGENSASPPGSASSMSDSDSESGLEDSESEGTGDESVTSTEEDEYIPNSRVYHPLVAINKHIMKTRRDATITITHDDDWISLLDDEQDGNLSDSTLISRVQRRMSVIVSHDGHATIVKKDSRADSPDIEMMDLAGQDTPEGLDTPDPSQIEAYHARPRTSGAWSDSRNQLCSRSTTIVGLRHGDQGEPTAQQELCATNEEAPRFTSSSTGPPVGNPRAPQFDEISPGLANGAVEGDRECRDAQSPVDWEGSDYVTPCEESLTSEICNPNHKSDWRSQSGSPTFSLCPSPTLVDNRRLYGKEGTEVVEEVGTKEVFRDVVKGRKSWKTLKGGEMVWPPELEAALLEGLASYQPDDSRETRLLGRYISAYIYQKTGKQRTAKQVGSRLQQLRDTCGTKKLQHLLSPGRNRAPNPASKAYQYNSLHRYGLPSESHSSSDNSALNSPVSETLDTASGQNLSTPVFTIYIPPGTSYDSRFLSEDSSSTSSIGAETRPRSIQELDPTLTFTSYSSLDRSARSFFEVHHSRKQLVHREDCPLQPSQLSGADEEGRYLYSTPLVPGFWDTICNDADPTEYTIKHDVVKDVASNASPLFSAVYKFRYPMDANARRDRASSSSDFNIRTSHPTFDRTFPFECSNGTDKSFGSLSGVTYSNPEIGPLFDSSCYQNSGSVSPRSEFNPVEYVRQGSGSTEAPSTWFLSPASRPTHVSAACSLGPTATGWLA
ncbi:hypothetical protein PQX77_016158 [Marasmius sp. AFHP31]|nr:hypothetical protein PQX77_016158 [Marasmius sp. AFHP31]